MTKLSKEIILKMHTELIAQTGGADGIRDEFLLDSALSQPFQTFDENELYPTLEAKAARLAFGIAKNHAMIDGNKRLAAHSMLVFLAVNGVELDYTQEELADTFLKLAASEIEETELLDWILWHER